MARAKKNVAENKEVEIEEVEIEEKEIESKKKTEKRDKKKANRKTAMREIKKKMASIDVEIQNISDGECIYRDYRNRAIFDLMPNETKMVSLDDLLDVVSNCRGYFRTYKIIIIDVVDDNDEFTINDIVSYLGLDEFYIGMGLPEEDFMDILLEDKEYDEFKEIVESANEELVYAIAVSMVAKVKDEDYDERDKMRLMSKKMPKLKDIFLDAEEDKY